MLFIFLTKFLLWARTYLLCLLFCFFFLILEGFSKKVSTQKKKITNSFDYFDPIELILSFNILGLDLSITNLIFVGFLTIISLNLLLLFEKSFFSNKIKTNNACFGLNNIILNSFYFSLSQTVLENKQEKFFQIFSCLFFFIVISNFIGLAPSSSTITSYVTVTMLISFSLIIGINIILWNNKKEKALLLFLPKNTKVELAVLLIPIEFISHLAKPISLGVRLFVNLMSGHSLLKVLAMFAITAFSENCFKSYLYVIPVFALSLLTILECVVGIVQAFVFVMLTKVYLTETT